MEKVTDPQKITTDAEMLRQLDGLGIDKDDVEFWHDYAPRGNEYNPYAKFYRHTKSDKKFMVVSGLPKVNADGVKICGDVEGETTVGWDEVEEGKKYKLRVNIFDGEIDEGKVTLKNLNDQPTGTKKDDVVIWEPQLFLDDIEQTCGDAVLLATDPSNQFYHDNVLEWDYGICIRRLRVIEGKCRERWIFTQDPQGEVRIKHNKQGAIRLRLGEYAINDDEELIPASAFTEAEYPLEIGASPETFYPDAHVENTSVDGWVRQVGAELTWSDIVGAAGNSPLDELDYMGAYITSHASTEDRWAVLGRCIILFDTSGLPDAADVTGATLTVYGGYKADDLSITPDINVYSSDPFSNTALQADDFVDIGTTPLCDTPLTYAGWNVGTPGTANDFVLNAAGITTDTQLNRDGVSKYGLRNANYDVADELDPGNHDPAWTANKASYINPWAADKGEGYKPTLVVTYTEAVTFIPTVTII